MKMSADTGKAIGLILICSGVLFFLIGLAARLKTGFESRAEISAMGFYTAGTLAALGVVFFILARKGKQG